MDDKSKTGNPDHSRINTHENDELEDWSKKFGVSKEKLKTAIKAVGDQVKAVEAYLKNKPL